ncbi:MAG: NAD(P)-dependent oxidoreductase [Desulfovibrio sp.]|jgi:UDP-glucose 4-epimerase|nr:NAD(P)-dependent oxidoreductase [Desulfovibrio sp.]
MRILVTGGGGFIGSNLVKALLRQGDEVVVIDLAPKPQIFNNDTLIYVRGDCGSEIDIYRVMAEHKIEGILHLGAMMAGPCEANPPAAFRANFRSTQTLLDASVAFGVKRFFFMSSISVYDPVQSEPVPHNGLKNPPNIYGQTKLAGEHLLRWYTQNHGIDSRGIRPTWVWGPNRQHGLTTLYTTAMINRIAEGGNVFIDNPNECGDWLYIHDCVKAVMLAWNAKEPGERIYTICGSVHSIREVAEIAMKYCPEATVTFSAKAVKPSPYAVCFDDSAAKRDLGWKPDYSIEDAVKDHLSTVLNKKL